MLLKVYRLLTYVLSPVIDVYLRWRQSDGKEDPERFRERLGYASFSRPQGSLVWIHAASVGESVSVLPLIQKLLDQYVEVKVLLTTGTVSSARLMESRLPERAFHQYVPVDRIFSVHRFLKHWKPDLAVWVESELWPNLIVETNALDCPMILLNARMSERSFVKWRRLHVLVRQLLGCFSLIFPQSEQDVWRFKMLGARNVMFLGNIKYDAPPLPVDSKEMGALVAMMGDRPVWLAASTHPGEEEMVAEVHKLLSDKYTDLLTILVPRHDTRGKDVAELLKGQELKAVRRSQGEAVDEDTDVYVADTIGELGLFYRLSNIVFIGGSLVDHGGQNPLEAARLNCAIVCGPYMGNFSEVCREFIAKEAMVTVENTAALAETLDELLSNHEKQEAYSEAAKGVMEEQKSVIDSVLGTLDIYLSAMSRKVEPDESATQGS